MNRNETTDIEQSDEFHPDDQQLCAFASGKPLSGSVDLIEQHLLNCESCNQRLDQLDSDAKCYDQFVDRVREIASDEFPVSTSNTSTGNNASSTPAAAIGETLARAPGIASHDLEIGSKFGKYRVDALLGSGGMGVVYQAHDTVIGRDVALKLLPSTSSGKQDSVERFLREARAIGQLNHEHVLTMFDVDTVGETRFLAMELAPGGSLAARVSNEGPLEWRDATRLMIDACRGLQAAHDAGIIHRDIKPDNLLIADDNKVKVGDFGLARPDDQSAITHVQQAVGTPWFMSPEQCRGETADERSDIYALGATYYTLLSGRKPYAHVSDPVQVMSAQIHGEVPSLSSHATEHTTQIPDSCNSIVQRAMAKDPAERYQSCRELISDMESACGATIRQSAFADTQRVAFPATEKSGNKLALLESASTAGGRNFLLPIALVASLAVALSLGFAFMLWHSDRNDGPDTTVIVEKETDPPELSERGVAEHVIALGGKVEARANSKSYFAATADQLPQEEFAIQWIDFPSNEQVNDASLARMVRLKRLEGIALQNTQVTDAGIIHLSRIPTLRMLLISDTKVTDEGVVALARLPQLRDLTLSRTDISDRGLQAMQNMKLVNLRVASTGISDQGMEYLAQIPSLRALSLRKTAVSNDGLKQLRILSRLQKLDISYTSIDDAGLRWLHGMTSLTELTVNAPEKVGCKITQQGIDAFKKAMPKCRITYD